MVKMVVIILMVVIVAMVAKENIVGVFCLFLLFH